MKRRKQAKYSKCIDRSSSEALSDLVAEACRPDNDDVTRGSSFLPVYQLLPYWNHSHNQDQVSMSVCVCVCACVCVCVSVGVRRSAHQSNNERLTESQPGHNNV